MANPSQQSQPIGGMGKRMLPMDGTRGGGPQVQFPQPAPQFGRGIPGQLPTGYTPGSIVSNGGQMGRWSSGGNFHPMLNQPRTDPTTGAQTMSGVSATPFQGMTPPPQPNINPMAQGMGQQDPMQFLRQLFGGGGFGWGGGRGNIDPAFRGIDPNDPNRHMY